MIAIAAILFALSVLCAVIGAFGAPVRPNLGLLAFAFFVAALAVPTFNAL